jgi:recombination protein RecR
MEYPTKLIEQATGEIARLPGIGRKTALRLALYLLRRPEQESLDLAEAIRELRLKTTYCTICHHLSELEQCSICSSTRRDRTLLCVVENSRDVMAIESTGQYQGLYHVLGGVISPIDGVGPEDLNMATLLTRVPGSEIGEVIMALGVTMEGDTTSYFIQKKLQASGVRVSTIARGIPVGGELEFADEITLGRSIAARVQY